jgi:hypothetical protein
MVPELDGTNNLAQDYELSEKNTLESTPYLPILRLHEKK